MRPDPAPAQAAGYTLGLVPDLFAADGNDDERSRVDHRPGGQPPEPGYYTWLGNGRYRPSLHTQGAWQPHEQHMAPVSGVILHQVERFVREQFGDDGLQIARIGYEILGLIERTDFEIAVEVLRGGRTIQLLEATLTLAHRPVIRARIWRLSVQDTAAVTGGQPEPLPEPKTLPGWDGTHEWSGGYIASIQFRLLPGRQPGHTRAWLRTEQDLVSNEPSSDLARFVGLVDTANGIATRVRPGDWMFPNVDLTLHLYRQPRGRWVGLDTSVIFGGEGVGLTTSTLFDERGPVGRAEQILTIRSLGQAAP